jgi:hypothetical protein
MGSCSRRKRLIPVLSGRRSNIGIGGFLFISVSRLGQDKSIKTRKPRQSVYHVNKNHKPLQRLLQYGVHCVASMSKEGVVDEGIWCPGCRRPTWDEGHLDPLWPPTPTLQCLSFNWNSRFLFVFCSVLPNKFLRTGCLVRRCVIHRELKNRELPAGLSCPQN